MPMNLQATVIGSEKEFDDLLAANNGRKPVVVKFFASWCRKCLAMKPKFDRLAAGYGQVDFNTIEEDLKFLTLLRSPASYFCQGRG